jgi:deazaflavin-dependent oxidoreductase (nitroreductase family)
MVEPTTGRYVRSGWTMTHLVNPIVGRLGGTLVLIVAGRTTGEPRIVPLGAPFEAAGVLHLVGGGGETHWARNLRAAGHGQIRLRGTTRPFRAIELDGAERDRIVAAYRAKLGRRAEGFFRELPDAADHPVFRVEWA